VSRASKRVIKRDDGRWYAGTVDREPVFTDRERLAARFPSTEAAFRRIGGLRRSHGNHHFGVGFV